MIKEMNGWKVIYTSSIGARSSVIRTISDYSVHYSKYVRVYPKLKDSMLFFFAKKEDAEAFNVSTNYCRIIVPCIAYDCQRIKYRTLGNYCDVERFWKLRKNKKSTEELVTLPAPKGSWVAKSIKCLE